MEELFVFLYRNTKPALHMYARMVGSSVECQHRCTVPPVVSIPPFCPSTKTCEMRIDILPTQFGHRPRTVS